jgi:hypothetical protein
VEEYSNNNDIQDARRTDLEESLSESEEGFEHEGQSVPSYYMSTSSSV